MEDEKIVALYWERCETAIAETQNKYGRYCHAIAFGILQNDGEAEECVNDAIMNAWNSIPPHRPMKLSTFLGKITRNLALNRSLYHRAQKRHGTADVILEEVAEFLPDPESKGSIVDEIHLRSTINRFLASLPAQTRKIFVRRYWYLSPVKEIAADLGKSESAVKVILMRTRNKFKAYLEAEGIEI